MGMNNIVSLFSRRRSGDSFEAVLAPHMERLYKPAFQYMGNAGDAEDLLQDFLVELYGRQQQMAEAENLPAWLHRCLYHRFIDGHRKLARRPQQDDIAGMEIESAGHGPEESHYHRQVMAALDHLNAVQRTVVTMHDLNGYTLPELSDIMDMPVGTLKSHLHRARKQLKQRLKLGAADALRSAREV